MTATDGQNCIYEKSTENMTGVTVIMPYHRKDERVLQNLVRVRAVRHVREVLLINDGCDWEPNTLIAELLGEETASDQVIRLIRNGRGKGVSGARNTGIIHAGQPLICFLDYDDFIFPDRFDRDMEHFLDDDCHATVCEFDTVYEDGLTSTEKWRVPYKPGLFRNGAEFFANSYLGVPHLTCFTYRKSTLLAQGILFDEDLRGSEDSMFKYSCVESFGFRTSPGLIGVHIMRHAHNTTSNVYSKRLLEYRLTFFWRFSSIFIKYPVAFGHFRQSYLKTLRRYLRNGGRPLLILKHAYGVARVWMGRPAGA
jgi:glycosyltransferase involved in cell wall biosynthesis